MPRAHGCARVVNYRDVRAENCSCIFCPSAVRGGRMALLYGPMDSLEECKQKAAMDFIISSEIVFDPLDY